MMMKRLLLLVAALALGACSLTHKNQNVYADPPFYAKYLNTGSDLDARINRTLADLRANPRSASLHNDLGQLLLAKGFPNDAQTEFERAVNADSRFYPAWYNLGLIRMSRGEQVGARFAFSRTVHYKPGHSAALFQLGLMEEQRGHQQSALDYYVKALTINRSLLDVRVNPRVLDSQLMAVALVQAYPNDHARGSMTFQPTPAGYVQRNLEAPSTQPAGKDIVTPAPSVTEPARQPAPPTPGAPVPAQPTPQPATKPPL
jgi:tetratricopeptide (TPR) repeat protein